MREPATSELSELFCGPHGGRANEFERFLGLDEGKLLDLSASMNPFAVNFSTELTSAMSCLSSYPDTKASTKRLAIALGVDPDALLITNGGAEAISLVAQHFERGWADEFEFGLYRRHISVLDPSGIRYRSNPHNPTGALGDRSFWAEVIDEAFYPLATGTWSRRDFESGAIVIGSLTKLSSLPGLRLGYLVAPNVELANRLRELQPRWSVSSLALAMVPPILDSVDLESACKSITTARESLCGVLDRFDVEYLPSSTNYVFVPHAPGLAQGLLKHGVLVRDCTSFGFPDAVRIAVGPDATCSVLEHALERAL